MRPARHVVLSFTFLLLVILTGAFGYAVIEGWGFFESLYMAIITITTVGFREVHELSITGQVFTICLIFFSLGAIAYSGSSLMQFVVEGQLREIFGRKHMEKKISSLENHFIICGYGRIGAFICNELKAKPVPFVVVEKSPALCEKLAADGFLFVQGDATGDDALIHAGILRARGLVTAVTSDADNVFITLTARGLNPHLFILARAGETNSETKLKRAGASKVISPYTIGAHRMAQAILRPSVVDFLEIATAGRHLELQLEEIRINPGSSLAQKTLINSGIRRDLGVIIIAIKKSDGRMLFNPTPENLLETGDTLITLGKGEGIAHLAEIAGHT
jgi:voltage-gated potassium channel